ncbi:Clp protease N-terminal domain-containing protein [Actinomycetospora sp. CA-101289]|uniref:Clp protease N-terminal domain-containing protein n=1 Tax=Actinomycetospora sp. CA-101289 TaxID=3239893 RepID=UPI003D96E3B4
MRLATRQTARLTRVFLIADQEAARDGAARVGTAHLLLALVRDEHEHGGRLADRVDVGEVRAEVARRPVRAGGTGRRAWTPAALVAVDAALRAASQGADEPVVGVRHLLLGVLADAADDAATVLRALDVDVDDLVDAAGADLRADMADMADIAVRH